MKLFLRSIAYVALICAAPTAFAQYNVWTNSATDGSFDTASNWTSNSVPSNGDDTYIFPAFTFTSGLLVSQGGPSTINISTLNNQQVKGLFTSSSFAFVGGTLPNTTGIINLTLGTTSTPNALKTLTIGPNGGFIGGGDTLNFTGNLNMSTGTLIIGDTSTTTDLFLVNQVGSGKLNLITGTTNFDGSTSLIVGNNSSSTSGFVTQGTIGATPAQNTSSTVTMGHNLSIGLAGGVGTYSVVSDSVLNIGDQTTPQAATYTVSVGDTGGTGTLNISDTATVNSASGMPTTIDVGVSSTSTGTINQSGGTLNTDSNTTFIVGDHGTGTYNMSGGTANLQGGMFVGKNSGSTGTVNQSSGTIIIGAGQALNMADSTSVYNLNGGVLEVGGAGGIIGNGTINFNGGTLQAINSDLISSLSGTTSGNSSLDTTNANITLNGDLSGTGGFTILGPNSVTLTGNNSFTGDINISSGTLNAGVNNLASNSVAIGSTGTFNLNLPFSDTYTGAITGSGAFNVASNGHLLELTNNFNFSGTTSITGNGALQIFNGTVGNLQGDSAVFVGFDSSVATSGTVNLVGLNNTISGPMFIENNFTVMASNYTGDIINHGTFGSNQAFTTTQAPTFVTSGDLASDNTLVIRLNGPVSDEFDANTAHLTNTIKVIGAAGNQVYTVVKTTAGLTTGALGDPDPVTGLSLSYPVSPILTLTLLSDADNLYIQADQATIESLSATTHFNHNQLAVAQSIDQIILNPGVFSPIVAAVDGLTADQIPGAMDQLSPEILQYSRNIAFENATFLAMQVNGHMANLRNGYQGLDTSGLSFFAPGFDSSMARSLNSLLAYNNPAPNGVNYYPSDFDDNSSPSVRGPSGRSISDSPSPMRPSAMPAPSASGIEGSRFSEFVSGDIVLANLNRNQSTTDNSPPSKASYTAGDATAGVSFRMTNNLAAGVLFDYNHTDAKTDSSGSRTRVDSYSPGLFATFFQGGFYTNALMAYGYNDYSNNRNIVFGGMNRTATSSPNGNQYVGNLDFGYDFKPDTHWALGPTLGMTYTHLDIDSFSESGAGPADLTVDGQHADSFRSRLGAHASYQVRTGSVVFQPNFILAWQHEYLDDASDITSQFNAPGMTPFSILTSAPSRDSALVGIGVTAMLDQSLTLYLNYLANVGAQDYFAQSVQGGFKARF